ncbi:MAG: DNA polymerase I [Granulosicoccus sp.]|nr:DNA polymerase I [Granulosicoccus sp.]
MSESAPLLLVDGSSYLYRAFHAMPPLNAANGNPTGAVFGVVKMVRKLISDYQSERVAVVFDAKGKTFRDDLFKEYKANRPSMPDDLRVQIEPLHNIIKGLGIPMLIVPGVEADDVIGTLAVQGQAAGQNIVISTGDKDMAQLVDDHVTLINTMNNTTMDAKGVEEKFGVKPAQIIDYLALMGDSSDNIPGVNGCGPKTAVKWLQQYDTVDNLIEHADEIKGKIGEKLRAGLELIPLSRQLATIKTDVDLDVKLDDLVLGESDPTALHALYTELGFRSWLKELDGGVPAASTRAGAPPASTSSAGAPESKPMDERTYDTVLTRKDLTRWVKKLKKAKLVAFDTETTSLDYMEAEMVGVSVCVTPFEAAYIPVAHSYEGAPKQLTIESVLAELKPILEDPKIPLVGQNLKYDANVLRKYGIVLSNIEHDTMLESYVLNSTSTRHDMDTLAEKYLGESTIHFEDIAGKGKAQLTFDQIPLDIASPYAAEDADITLRLHQALWPQLTEIPELQNLYSEIEVALLPVLSQVEYNGVKIDAAMLEKQSEEIADKLESIQQAAYADAGREFNLGSPKQIQEVFYEEKKFPILKKTPKGQPSTAEEVLEQLAVDYELPRLMLQYRSLSKLKSTYTDKLPASINPTSGRVHTSYQQAVASTGRLSSKDPNLQNIPVRTEEGRRIREAFIAEKGYRILAADYSQIELRIMAHLSEDKGLLTAFEKGLDVHKATAAEVFSVPIDNVEADQRRSAKAINFGLIYGMSAFGLAKQLSIPRGEAQEYIDLYFARYPGVKAYMDNTRVLAKDQGYVETVFGRRLYLPDINARNAQMRQYAERTAINAPMQGTAADIIKRAMITVDEWITNESIDARMIMQVHDELVLEVKAGQADSIGKKLSQLMCDAAELKIPLEVDVGVGNSWEEAH